MDATNDSEKSGIIRRLIFSRLQSAREFVGLFADGRWQIADE